MDTENTAADTPPSQPSRRQFIAGMATGLIATTSPSAFGQTSGVVPNELQFEQAQPNYPRPPFPEQQQEWPGLASLMNPVPDHGETRYRGTGRLKGRKALVTGGDSG